MAQWKPPRKSDTSAADAKKRKNEDDQRGEAATTEGGGGGGEVDGEVDAALGNRSIDVEVEKDVEVRREGRDAFAVAATEKAFPLQPSLASGDTEPSPARRLGEEARLVRRFVNL